MLFRKLESKLNTQNQTYWVFGYSGHERVRSRRALNAPVLAILALNGLSVLAKKA